MIHIINEHHVQFYTISNIGHYDAEVYLADSFEEAVTLANEGEDTLFSGFIYDERVLNDVMNRHPSVKRTIENYNVYYVSDIGVLPERFITLDKSKQHYSLYHQILELNIEGFDLWDMDEAKAHTDYFNFKSSRDVYRVSERYEKEVDILKEKCYSEGNVYLLYEVLPQYKLPVAYKVLEKVDKGIVVIGSQTRSNNDILTFYVKGMNTAGVAEMFGVEHTIDSNVFHQFVNSHINILGRQITQFIKGKGSNHE